MWALCCDALRSTLDSLQACLSTIIADTAGSMSLFERTGGTGAGQSGDLERTSGTAELVNLNLNS